MARKSAVTVVLHSDQKLDWIGSALQNSLITDKWRIHLSCITLDSLMSTTRHYTGLILGALSKVQAAGSLRGSYVALLHSTAPRTTTVRTADTSSEL